jgi:DNA-binding NarL/FixJ family response regulator
LIECEHDGMVGEPRVVVGVVDDHPAIGLGTLAGLQEQVPTIVNGGCAPTVSAFLDMLDATAVDDRADLVLLDVSLSDLSTPETNVRRLVSAGIPTLLYTQDTRTRLLARCLKAGAMGVVGKHESFATLAEAVLTVASGNPHINTTWANALNADRDWVIPALAPREAEALRLFASGIPIKSVARRMSISYETAREHLRRVRRKYSEAGRPAPTRSELFVRAVEDGYLTGPDST